MLYFFGKVLYSGGAFYATTPNANSKRGQPMQKLLKTAAITAIAASLLWVLYFQVLCDNPIAVIMEGDRAVYIDRRDRAVNDNTTQIEEAIARDGTWTGRIIQFKYEHLGQGITYWVDYKPSPSQKIPPGVLLISSEDPMAQKAYRDLAEFKKAIPKFQWWQRFP